MATVSRLCTCCATAKAYLIRFHYKGNLNTGNIKRPYPSGSWLLFPLSYSKVQGYLRSSATLPYRGIVFRGAEDL